MADGKIVFNTKIDNSNIEKDLKGLERKIQKSQESIAKSENEKMPLVKQAEELGARLDEAKAKAAQLKAEMAEINTAMGVGSETGAYTDAYLRSDQVAADLKAQEAEVDQLQKQWDRVVDKVDNYDRKIKDAQDTIVRSKEKASGLVKQMNGAGTAMKSAFTKAKTAATSFEKRIISLGKRIFIFTVIAQAFRAIKEYMGKVLKTNEEYTAQIAKLKAALVTAFQPLYEFILPGLITALKVLTDIVSALANMMSALFGTTLEQSAEAAKKLNEEAEALENVSEEAKKAKKNLAGFDEINKLSAADTSSTSDTGTTYNFEDFNSDEYKKKIDELTVSLEGALLAIGAILAFSGANIPLGIALMGIGATALAKDANLDWNCMKTYLEGANGLVVGALSGMALAIGAILTFSSTNIPLGIALMAIGAAGLAAAVAVNWGTMKNLLEGASGLVVGVLSGALLSIGAILAFSGANIPLGIGLMAIGAVGLGASIAANWGTLKPKLQEAVDRIAPIFRTSLLVLGALLAFTGANVPLGIGLMAAGAIGLAEYVAVNWNTISQALRGPVGAVVGIVSGALLALGAILTFSGANLPLGIGLMAAGAVGLAMTATVNWDSIVTALQGPLGAVLGLAGAFLLVIGMVLAFTGAGLPLGLGLMAAGGAALGTAIAPNWNFLKEKLEGAWGDIVDWYDTEVAPVFTKKYWQDKWSTITDGLSESFKNGINGAITLFNKFIDYINDKLSFSWDAAYIGSAKIFDAGSIQLVNIPNIPYLAKGAVIPPNAPFMAMLGDQKHGTNIEAPLETIQEAVALVMEDMTGGMMAGFEALLEENAKLRQIVENIEIGDDVIGRAAARYNSKMAVMRGG